MKYNFDIEKLSTLLILKPENSTVKILEYYFENKRPKISLIMKKN